MSSPGVTFNLTCGKGVTELQNLTNLHLPSFAESHQMQQKCFDVYPYTIPVVHATQKNATYLPEGSAWSKGSDSLRERAFRAKTGEEMRHLFVGTVIGMLRRGAGNRVPPG